MTSFGKKFENVSKKVQQAQKTVSRLQNGDRSEVNLRRTREAEQGLNRALLLEEHYYWKHRSIIDWLKAGDSNTKFFHSKAASRRKKNLIRFLEDENCRRHETEKSLTSFAVILKVFSALLVLIMLKWIRLNNVRSILLLKIRKTVLTCHSQLQKWRQRYLVRQVSRPGWIPQYFLPEDVDYCWGTCLKSLLGHTERVQICGGTE